MNAPSATLRRIDRQKARLESFLRAIRGECSKQGLDDATRRDLIERFAGPGKRSQKDLDVTTAEQLLDHLHHKINEWSFVFRLPAERQMLGKKIYRCAEKIGAAQLPPVKVMSKSWVEGIARQALGLNHPDIAKKVAKPLETCDGRELLLVIQILESWAKTIKA